MNSRRWFAKQSTVPGKKNFHKWSDRSPIHYLQWQWFIFISNFSLWRDNFTDWWVWN